MCGQLGRTPIVPVPTAAPLRSAQRRLEARAERRSEHRKEFWTSALVLSELSSYGLRPMQNVLASIVLRATQPGRGDAFGEDSARRCETYLSAKVCNLSAPPR